MDIGREERVINVEPLWVPIEPAEAEREPVPTRETEAAEPV
ncbi:hypothetical protein BMS3Abin02_01213 [bacterium BMS3Abin02]|nr:hypothetical protein BMS3Abin02_01213 [bacterium BMS3Abin02]GBE21619.1 hypothetical protein BMS3Bbin01_00964 [bacterium BMS3Bbin01]